MEDCLPRPGCPVMDRLGTPREVRKANERNQWPPVRRSQVGSSSEKRDPGRIK